MALPVISSEQCDHQRRGYPRPQLRRDEWYSLNGPWQFALDPDGRWLTGGQVDWSERIVVPFAPEAPLSGIGHTGFFRACWYRTRVELPRSEPGERWFLHFGAVDWQATVWVNGGYAGVHEGGYTPFCFDITDLLSDGVCEITVRADDDPSDLAKPRGKQDWQLEPHSIWYPRTSGIWQTVWLEKVPSTYISRVAFTPNLARWEIGIEAWLGGERRPGLRLAVRLRSGDSVLAADTYQVVNEAVHRAALRWRAGRPVPAQRPDVSAADGARPGLLAGGWPDSSGRRCAEA
jgi:hypothetical protein